MFILRKLTSELSNRNIYQESNEIVGSSYQLIYDHNDAFPSMVKEYDNSENQIYAFLVFKSGSEVLPLYKGMGNYMMTENGQTFANLTFK